MSLMLEFYGLREHPFGVSPNSRFFYASAKHEEALELLEIGIDEHDGLSALIAEAGTGKTTLLLNLVEHYRGKASVALVLNTQPSGEALLRMIAAEFHVPGAESEREPIRLQQLLSQFVHDSTEKLILMIDEAQNLDALALEAVRLLSNLEAATHQRMHIVLAGQPALETNLRGASQVMQRVTTISRLAPLPAAQVSDYIQCRLQVAGYTGLYLFSDEALASIENATRGIPREINRVAMNALQLGYGLGQKQITGAAVDAVLADLNHTPKRNRRTTDHRNFNEEFADRDDEENTVGEAAISAIRPESSSPPIDRARTGLSDALVDTGLPEYPAHADVANLRSPLDPAIDIGLGDEVIDSVLLGVEEQVEAKPVSSQPIHSATTASGKSLPEISARSVLIPSDASLDSFLAKLEAGDDLASRTAPPPRPAMNGGETKAETPLVSRGPESSQRFERKEPQLPASNTLSKSSSKVDPRVSQIFAPKPSRYVPPPAVTASTPPSTPVIPVPPSVSAPNAAHNPTLLTAPSSSTRKPGANEPAKKPPTPASIAVAVGILVFAGVFLLAYSGVVNTPFVPAKPPVVQKAVLLPPRPPVEEKKEPNPSEVAAAKEAKPPKPKKSKPVLIKLVRPAFPTEARRQHLNGNVLMEVYIDASGGVQRTQVLSGNPVLAKAAIAAVEKWKYMPARENGVAIPGQERIVVTFDEKQ